MSALLLRASLLLTCLAGHPQAQQGQQDPAPALPPPTARNVDALFEGALIGARDGQDFHETPGYRRLLEIVSRYGEQELRGQVQRELDFSDALARPDAWRGEFVHVRGVIAGLQAVRLSAPLAERVDAYRAILTEADGSEAVVVDFLEPPPEIEVQRDAVDVDGVFFRTVRYENRNDAAVEVPYLIARNLRTLDPTAAPRSTRLDLISQLLIGAAVVFVVARILMSLRRPGAPRKPKRAPRVPPPGARPTLPSPLDKKC
jgi:hypothetical protein